MRNIPSADGPVPDDLEEPPKLRAWNKLTSLRSSGLGTKPKALLRSRANLVAFSFIRQEEGARVVPRIEPDLFGSGGRVFAANWRDGFQRCVG